MSLTINHNLMAYNTARNLNSHYASLSTSVRRLSSGLRVNSSADDAAGLAIRELMRADIASLNQGVRNVNDAVSMIQTADGALQVIDEKLIRMKELAEQAATGTYNSDQRLMINSEFQAMKAEIDRIAKATDFNGVKLLCNDPANKIIRDDGNATLSDYEYTGDGSHSFKTVILNKNAILNSSQNLKIKENWILDIDSYSGDNSIEIFGTGAIWDYATSSYINENEKYTMSYTVTNGQWGQWDFISTTSTSGYFQYYDIYQNAQDCTLRGYSDATHSTLLYAMSIHPMTYIGTNKRDSILLSDTIVTFASKNPRQYPYRHSVIQNNDYPNAKLVDQTLNQEYGDERYVESFYIDLDGDGTADIVQKFDIDDGNTVFSLLNFEVQFGTPTTKIHFGTGNDSAEDYYYIDTKDCTANGLGIAGTSIETQDKAQRALEEIDNAIITKDNARAYFGAMQNRLENTASNLRIQAENLQASESRISDVDVSTEMTEYARSQILTQAAVAMLAQANSLPNMALQLITNK